MSKAPVIRQYAWAAAIPQFLLLGLIIMLLVTLTGLPADLAFWIGAFIYLGYSVASRSIVAKAHKAGMRCVKAGDFASAIPYFEESYTFFSNKKWLDRFRFLLLCSSTKASYREMALLNIAFCYGQIGDGERCLIYYKRAASEFPHSALAHTGLRMARSFGGQQQEEA
jgi:tetratricopeptide (TPR) repeat protein